MTSQLDAAAPQSTRERILDVATGLFVNNGYTGAPLSAIAGQLDLTKAALYYHFKSKVEILVAIVSPLLGDVDALLEGTPEQFSTPEERWAFLEAYTDLLLSNPRAVSVLASVDIHDSLPEEIAERIRWHRERTTKLGMLAGMSDVAKVRAIIVIDVLHRETVFSEDRMVVDGMTAERRREIVLDFVRETLDA